MDPKWLEEIFAESGLPADVARSAGADALRRLTEREAAPLAARGPSRITDALVTDPTLSVKRILERGRLGLPLHDPDSGRLSLAALADVLVDAGEDPVPAMAFARVIVEAVEPERLYGPVWRALGGEGPVDLEALARLDWSPLAPERGSSEATEQVLARGAPTAPRGADGKRRAPVRKPSVSVRPPKPKGPRS